MNTEVSRLVSVLLTLVHDTELSRYWTPQDERMLISRCEAEGLTFLTSTLPGLAKSLHTMFSCGIFKCAPGFRRATKKAYPMFMRKAWEVLVPDHYEIDGEVFGLPAPGLGNGNEFLFLESAHNLAGAVKAIRQVSLMYYKTKLPYSPEQVKAVTDAFIAAEAELADLDLSEGSDHCQQQFDIGIDSATVLPGTVDSLLTRASHYVHRLLRGFNPRNIRPRHGSGASACKVEPWERYKFPRFIPKLDAVYPYSDWFYLSHGVDCLPEEKIDSLEVVEEPMARVVFVPKDSRGPRLISAEPREFMYIQQGLMDLLYRAIDTYPMVKAQLDCRDQTRNQRLARWGSASGAVATLDLKEASDRVSLTLVERLFPRDWVECFKACRSIHTKLPDGTVVPFRKFAPMGSAVCFPVEAICFWAIANAAIPLSGMDKSNLFSATPYGLESNQLAVFGDDIIVPASEASCVVSALSIVGLSVNLEKSYLEGPFRESCGKEYLLGEDVSIVKCRELPASRGTRNMMDRARFRTADWFNNLIIRYGTYVLTRPLADLFESWYGGIPVTERVVLGEDEFSQATVPSRGLLLLGHTREIPVSFAVGVYDKKIPQHPRKSRGAKMLARKKPKEVKPRLRWNSKLHRLEVYTLVELPVIQRIDIDDWSHLLRILLNGSGVEDASTWTLAKRCRYKYGWVAV